MSYELGVKNKKILITAGPTWVPIDKVRVISNIATGETGILLAEKLARLGAKVTLLLGPADACCLDKRIRLVRFKFFDELKNKLCRELKSCRYHCLIHNAAVSDYRPKAQFSVKLSSQRKKITLNLVPTEKIINRIKRIDKCIFLVGFKFQPQAGRLLLKQAQELMRSSGADLVAANSIAKNGYRAYIVGRKSCVGPLNSKNKLADKLTEIISEELWKN